MATVIEADHAHVPAVGLVDPEPVERGRDGPLTIDLQALSGAHVFKINVVFGGAQTLAVAPGGHPWFWLSALLAWLSSYLLLGPLAAALSAVFPAHADLNRMGKAGNPHPIAGVLGLLVTGATMLPSLLLLLVGFIALRGPWITVAALALWTAVCGALAIPLVRFAARVVERRRENLLLVAAGR